MNNPVSFPIAKLLKEKEFDKNEEVYKFYVKPRSKMFGTDEKGRYYPMKNIPKKLYTIGEHAALNSTSVYIAPTISDVVMWIYEKYGIWIYSYPIQPFLTADDEQYPKIVWIAMCVSMNQVMFEKFIDADNGLAINHHKSETSAYEAAIEYTLTNLIK